MSLGKRKLAGRSHKYLYCCLSVDGERGALGIQCKRKEKIKEEVISSKEKEICIQITHQIFTGGCGNRLMS